ncbi:MAG: dihydrolipoamide acetyltransferase family protein [Kyrpidia sp.]|nr:dihydrolipoamide acetyltransferase family protein [Kyrpidia sp.]
MIYRWKLPDVGEGIHEAEIVRWRVHPGDVVESDQVLLEVQTDKATVEIPSPVAGRVIQVHGDEGQIVPVGTVLVEIETGSDHAAAVSGLSPAVNGSGLGSETAEPGPSGGPAVPEIEGGEGTGGARRRAKAAPAVRRLARELGIDINAVPGTGPGGRVMEEDVRAFAARPAASAGAVETHEVAEAVEAGQSVREPESWGAPVGIRGASGAGAGREPEEERIPLRGVRRAIAEHMVRSKFTIPHVTGMDEADVTELVALRRRIQETAVPDRASITYLPFIIKAVVSGLKQYPYLNASLDEERKEIVVKRVYHIGIAVDAPDGLVVPVIRDADRKSLAQLAAEIEELKEKARAGSLAPEQIRGGTFTISNIGSFGGFFATPIIHYPQAAILATGKIVRRPVILDDDRVVGRYMMPVSLTFDHRIIDGGLSTRFMLHVMHLLSHPLQLMVNL